jgi:hypothetical protein
VRAGLALVVGCSSDASPARTTSTLGATTTVLLATTVGAATTTPSSQPAAVTSSVLTSAPPTTSPATTSPPPTTSPVTVAPASLPVSLPASSSSVIDRAALVLRDNSLGDAVFGADPDVVVATVSAVIGAPTLDSGWMDPLSLGSCPGTVVRTVTWGQLVLFFGDESRVVTGRRHFFAYAYGPASGGAAIDPGGLQTDAGIGIGSTITQLRAAYPNVVVTPADPTSPASFQASPALTGLLSSDQATGTVTEVSGGFGCGE